MRIKLLLLHLENFKKFREAIFEPLGQNYKLKGDNATGKTTHLDAFTWLLFGKDSQGNTDFSLKTLDKNEKPIPNINHTVIGEIDVDGKQIQLARTLKEKWVKQKGNIKPTFTGHTTDYCIDGVPVKQKEYTATIASIIDEEKFKLLTSVTYFNSLPWEKRRAILFSICEGISEDSISQAEKQKKITMSKKRDINKKLEDIPIRIDELQKSIVSSANLDKNVIQKDIETFEAKIEEMKSLNSEDIFYKERREIQNDLAKLEAEDFRNKDSLRKKLVIAENKHGRITTEQKRLEDELLFATKKIQEIEDRISELGYAFKETSEQVFEATTHCPTCRQPLPSDQIEQAKEKWNVQKSQRAQNIFQSIRDVEKEKERFVNIIDSAKQRIKELKAEEPKIVDEIKKLEGQLEYVPDGILALKIKLKENNLLSKTMGRFSLENEILAFKTKLEQAYSFLAKLDNAEDTKKRIEELSIQEKSLAIEAEELEKALWEAEQEMQKQAKLVEEKVNEKFTLVKFKLFETLLNEGIKPVCVTMIDGVPYSHGLNKGGEINAGLDIINTLSKHYDIQCPVWIDNCESITEPLKLDTQTIKLIKDENYKEIHLEVINDN